MTKVDQQSELAALSRDGHLALRRVERQQTMIERLHAARGQPLTIGHLAEQVGVSPRTIARDVQRLRESGVPLQTRPGPRGGVQFAPIDRPASIELDLPEIAALMSSMAVLGPSVSDSASSAMRKLAEAVAPPVAGTRHQQT